MEKKDFRKLYEDLVKSDWFKKAYHDKSLGECPFEIPELEESDDERIRKQLIDAIEIGRSNSGISFTEEAASRFITWLEKHSEEEIQKIRKEEYTNGFNDAAGFGKQQEQKPTEKSINWTELTWKDINELEGIINNVHYEFRNGIGQESFGKEVLEKFREYKGDEYLDEIEQKPAESISQLAVQGKGVYKICPLCKERMIRDDSMVCTSMPPQYIYVCPKCGERECDTVMYDSSVDEKQQEQKPAEWSDEDDEMRKRAICACNFTIKRLLGSTHYEEACDWLKSLPIGFITYPNYNSDMVDLLVGELQTIAKDNGVPKQYDAEISWLKSLRPQPKEEWSEEDEDMLNSCISSIEEAKENRYAYKETDGDTSYDHEIAWLESLRNRVGKEFLQPHWKPSEEQMKALEDAFRKDGSDKYRRTINSLYQDLKKL